VRLCGGHRDGIIRCDGRLIRTENSVNSLQPRHTKEEFARRGQELFEREIRLRVQPVDDGKFVAIDIETGAFEMDSNDHAATERLIARVPDAQIWLTRVGHRAAYQFGGRPSSFGSERRAAACLAISLISPEFSLTAPFRSSIALPKWSIRSVIRPA